MGITAIAGRRSHRAGGGGRRDWPPPRSRSPAGLRLRVFSAPGGTCRPEGQQRLVGLGRGGFQAQRAVPARNGFPACRAPAARQPPRQRPAARYGLDLLCRQPAGPQQPRVRPAEIDDGGFNADAAARHRGSSPTRSPRSSATWAAVVGLRRPEGLALGAAMGPPKALSRRVATGWRGTRTAKVSSPAPRPAARRGNPRRRGSTRVKGPGQKCAAPRSARAHRSPPGPRRQPGRRDGRSAG